MMPHFNEKYSMDFKRQVTKFYKTHTARECAEKFGLSHGQIIGIVEMSRRKGIIGPRFKDTRCKRLWTHEELLFVIRHAGVQPRSWIGKKLKRGEARVIKERLKTFNSGTKFLNGMPRSWAVELWGENVPPGLKTNAGPSGGNRANFRFIIIPWPELLKVARERPTHPTVRRCVEAMAKFQIWIHGTKQIRKRLEGCLNG